MNQTDYEELKKTVDFMRREGILSMKLMGLELILGERVHESAPEVDIPVEKPNPRKGRDGLTAQEQEELYGRVFDAR